MSTIKIAITLQPELLKKLDDLVAAGEYPNRSQAIQKAIRDQLVEGRRQRLAQELEKISPEEEKALAEEGLSGDWAAWPES